MRQQLLAHAAHEDHRELQPLARMQRHQRDLVPVLLFPLLRDERQVERHRLHIAVEHSVGRGALRLIRPGDALHQLAHHLPPNLRHVGVGLIGPDGPLHPNLLQVAQQHRPKRLPVHLPQPLTGRIDDPGQLQHAGARLLRHLPLLRHPAHHLKERNALLLGRLVDVRHRRDADAPRRHIDDPPQRQLIMRIQQQPQVAERILDLLAVEEALRPHQPVGKPPRTQRLLELPRLVPRPKEDGELLQRPPLRRLLRPNPVGNPLRLFVIARQRHMLHQRPVAMRAPEVLHLPLRVPPDHLVGHPQDVAHRPVVLLQRDDLGRRVDLLEEQNRVRRRAAEAVNRLVVVTHHHQVELRRRHQLRQEGQLNRVGVLVLVHQNIPEHLPVLFPNIRPRPEELRRHQQQVVKVHRIEVLQRLLVVTEELLRPRHLGRELGRRQLRRRRHRILRLRDEPQDPVHGNRRRRELELLQHPLEHPLPLRLIQNREGPLVANRLNLIPQDVGAQRVEGVQPHLLGQVAIHQRGEPLSHLGRRLVGEGQPQNRARPNPPLQQQPDPVGDDPRLARTGTRKHQERPLIVLGCLPLRRVEAAEIHAAHRGRRGPPR